MDRRDPAKLYHKMDLAKFDSTTPSFNFARFLRAANTPPVESLNITSPAYFAGLNKVLASTSLDDWD